MSEKKVHWETIYTTKQPNEVSWTQDRPAASIDFILSCGLDKTARIIDIGGGDSNLVDHLLDLGYENITVLDISEHALERAKTRLGKRADQVTWVVSDILDFVPDSTFDIWHDRAAFHFLTKPTDIDRYVALATSSVTGYLIIGTFSTDGPLKCSGLEITQYNEQTLSDKLTNGFEKIRCLTEDHTTPFNTTQNFLFCTFRKKNN